MEPSVLQPDEDAQAVINALQRQADELIAQLRDASEELAKAHEEHAVAGKLVQQLREALSFLYGQVIQAKEGFGLYRNSPSMKDALITAQAALDATT